MTSELTHFDAQGRAHMVDVSQKDATTRVAIARGSVLMEPETLRRIAGGEIGKGDVLGVARLAGIMAAKRTHDLIPLCHPLPLSAVAIDLRPDIARNAVDIEAEVKTTGRTGVEMEALTAVAVACLTAVDMGKAVDKGMTIEGVRLLEKHGGRGGSWMAAR
jgi:cyclic pyranopterin phosphate synthase